MARPTVYNAEVAENICTRIADGESLKKISEDDEMPCRRQIHLWLVDGKHKEFTHNYEKACNIRTENMFDELEEIADNSDADESPMRSRLRVDTRKWYLSKVMPKKFGDKLDLTSKNKQLPAPILGNIKINDLSTDDSDQEDSETEE